MVSSYKDNPDDDREEADGGEEVGDAVAIPRVFKPPDTFLEYFYKRNINHHPGCQTEGGSEESVEYMVARADCYKADTLRMGTCEVGLSGDKSSQRMAWSFAGGRR